MNVDSSTRTEVGRRLQKIRGNRDQRSFAEAVDSVQQTISKYERGEIPRSWLFLARLHAEEGVDLNRLLGDGLRTTEDGGNGRGSENGGNGGNGNVSSVHGAVAGGAASAR